MPRRRHTLLLALVACACAVAALAAAASAADAQALLWSQASELPLPTNAANEEPEAALLGVSCPVAGSCAGAGAVGTDVGELGLASLVGGSAAGIITGQPIRPIVAAQSATGWSSTAITPPDEAEARKAYVGSISCAAPGDCVAVGAFKRKGTEEALPMSAFEASGVWQQATEVALPAGAAKAGQRAALTGVSCPASGTCTAVGAYVNGENTTAPMVVSETGGQWGQAEGIPLAEGQASKSNATLASVSCQAAGECTAVGEFSSSAGPLIAMAATEHDGSWSQSPRQFPPPEGVTGETMLDTVSCAVAGSCTAAGMSEYQRAGASEPSVAPFAVSQTAGTWGQSQTLPVSGTPQIAALTSVSCAAAGACAGVGISLSSTSTPALTGLRATQAGGAWEPIEAIAPPDNASAGTEAGSLMSAVSCAPGERCLAAGVYPEATSSGASFRAMTVTATPELQASATALPSGQVGSAYSAQLSAAGGSGAYHWALAAGSLPAGLTLNAATGAISGTPSTVGSSGFVVELSDPGPPAQKQLLTETIAITAAPPAAVAPVEAKPAIRIDASKLIAAHGKLAVTLACKQAPCKGVIKVTETVKKQQATHKGKAHKGKAQGSRVKTIVLAKGHYALAAGKVKQVSVKLTAKGSKILRKLAKHSKHRKHKHGKAKQSKHKHAKTLKAKLTVTLAGGTTQTKRVTIA